MLEKYYQKRDFKKTPEPKGSVGKRSGNRFVVQKHRARNLHYDFRLEIDGVLKSWAVPKNLPARLGSRHLAIATEDHPVAYADFQGEIPQGNYGAGSVEIWDQGLYTLVDRTENKLVFILRGKKLTGAYVLVTIGKQPKNWLIFKMKKR